MLQTASHTQSKAPHMHRTWEEVSELMCEAGLINSRNKLKQLFLNDDSFNALCNDYLECQDLIQLWSDSDEHDAILRIQQYKELREELGDEIFFYVLNRLDKK